MTDKLAFKHKNSLALKEAKTTPNRKKFKSAKLKSRSRSFYVMLFPVIICCVSLCYWFVLCPLLWFACYWSETSKRWPTFWPIFFWVVVILVWCLIVIILIMIWRLMETRCNNNINRKSYGSDHAAVPMCFTSNNAEVTKIGDLENDTNSSKFRLDEENNTNIPEKGKYVEIAESRNIADRSQNGFRRKNDLASLVIHRRMSGNDVENIGEVTVEDAQEKEEKEQIEIDDSSSNAQRNSIKDYLTLVTVTPLEEEMTSILSPKTPMSPRDLFFIDMIREADRAEKAKKNNDQDSKRFSRFFPNDSIMEMKEINNENDKNAQERTNVLENEDKSSKNDITSNTAGRESNYFIADVESPRNEKAEMFLEINPAVESESIEEKSIDLCSLNVGQNKPVLILRSASVDEKNSKKALN